MLLTAGTRVGSYEILAPIGAGGMGEVYKARDTKLKRNVALKVLPEAFARDSERMARFQREAEILASLNHPNIAAIYGVEHTGGIEALVMELVEGESPKGPLVFDDASHIVSQIAAALAYAHDSGIVHRDLKPANVKITSDGAVKLLDFGLAKAYSNQREPLADPENSPTLTFNPTEAGVILGTAAYMAPEQASGRAVDKRADIWSFGVVLYELLTGERMFQGSSAAEILAAVIHKQPDLSRAPLRARRLLQRCLEKDPKRRLRDVGEAMAWLEMGEGSEPSGTVPSSRGRIVVWRIAAVILAIAAAGLGVIAYHTTRPAELRPLVRLDVDLGSDVSLGSSAGADAIVSPDGARLVYVSHGKLFTRRLDQSTSMELAGTEGAFAPFFSPDGHWVGFFAQTKLKKIPVEGGAVIPLCEAPSGEGGTWDENGDIIAALTSGGGVLFRIPRSGGAPTALTQLAPGEATHRWPQILPGGKAVLFTAHSSTVMFDGANIEVVSLADHRIKTIHRGGTFGRYLATSPRGGHLVYVHKGTLFAVPFDLDNLETRGSPTPVLQRVAYNSINGSAQFDFSGPLSAPGTLVYRTGGVTGFPLFTVRWIDRSGKTEPLLTQPDSYGFVRLSPNGQRLAFSTDQVWVYELQRNMVRRLTFGGVNGIPVWSPDGRYLAFVKRGEGLFLNRADGAGIPQALTRSRSNPVPGSFTPDGKRLAFHQQSAPGGYDLWTVPLGSEGTGMRAGPPEPFLQTQFNEREPSFSPDGRWLAYVSDESGTNEVYVRAFPDNGSKWQVSNSGGVYPLWSRNGRELFFRTEQTGMVMVARYTAARDSFMVDRPKLWSDKPLPNATLGGANYDLAPDGKRIVALTAADNAKDQQESRHVIFLENFFDDLRRTVPISAK